MAKAVVAVVRNGAVDPVVLRGDVEVGVLDLDSADTPDPDRVVLRVGGQGDKEELYFPFVSEALEEAQDILLHEEPPERMELVGLEDEEEGEKTLWAFPLWEKGRGGSAVVFLVERGVAEPYVLGKGAVQVTVLDLDADLEEPHHVVLGLNDDRILNEDDLGELLPPELVPEWGTFSTVEDAVEAVREILARAPEGEILKLDLEGRDDEGDTLWVRVVWEDEEDLEVSGPL